MLNDRFGVEFGAMSADYDTEFVLTTGAGPIVDSEKLGMYAFILGLNYHFETAHHADLHVGAFTAMSNYDDLIFNTEIDRRDKFSYDDDYGYGVKFGVDLPFSADGKWIFSAELRYLLTILEGEDALADHDLDPIIVSVGVGYRF